MQLSIMEHNGINLKEKLVRCPSIEEKHNGVIFEHNFLMPKGIQDRFREFRRKKPGAVPAQGDVKVEYSFKGRPKSGGSGGPKAKKPKYV